MAEETKSSLVLGMKTDELKAKLADVRKELAAFKADLANLTPKTTTSSSSFQRELAQVQAQLKTLQAEVVSSAEKTQAKAASVERAGRSKRFKEGLTELERAYAEASFHEEGLILKAERLRQKQREAAAKNQLAFEGKQKAQFLKLQEAAAKKSVERDQLAEVINYQNRYKALKRREQLEQTQQYQLFRIQQKAVQDEQALMERRDLMLYKLRQKQAQSQFSSKVSGIVKDTQTDFGSQYNAQGLKVLTAQKLIDAGFRDEAVRRYGQSIVNQIPHLESFRRNLDQAAHSTGNLHALLRGAAGGAGALWLSYSRQMAPFLGGLLAVGGALKGIKESTEFDYQTRFVSALQGSGDPEGYKTIQADLIKNTQGSSKDLNENARALRVLQQTGVDAADGVKLLNTSLAASIMGEVDMKTATEDLVSVLEVFNLHSEDAATLSNNYKSAGDVIAFVSQETKANFHDVAQSLQGVTGVAQEYGVKLEEVAALQVLLGKQGIVGSRAGTYVRSAIESIYTDNSQKASRVKDILGFEAFDSATGKAKQFSTAISEIVTKLQGFDKKSQGQMIADLFPSWGAKAFRAVNGDLERFLSLITQAGNQQGLLLQQQSEIAESTQVKWDKLKATFDNAFTTSLADSTQLKESMTTLGDLLASPEFKDAIASLAVGFSNAAVAVAKMANAFGDFSNKWAEHMKAKKEVDDKDASTPFTWDRFTDWLPGTSFGGKYRKRISDQEAYNARIQEGINTDAPKIAATQIMQQATSGSSVDLPFKGPYNSRVNGLGLLPVTKGILPSLDLGLSAGLSVPMSDELNAKFGKLPGNSGAGTKKYGGKSDKSAERAAAKALRDEGKSDKSAERAAAKALRDEDRADRAELDRLRKAAEAKSKLEEDTLNFQRKVLDQKVQFGEISQAAANAILADETDLSNARQAELTRSQLAELDSYEFHAKKLSEANKTMVQTQREQLQAKLVQLQEDSRQTLELRRQKAELEISQIRRETETKVKEMQEGASRTLAVSRREFDRRNSTDVVGIAGQQAYESQFESDNASVQEALNTMNNRKESLSKLEASGKASTETLKAEKDAVDVAEESYRRLTQAQLENALAAKENAEAQEATRQTFEDGWNNAMSEYTKTVQNRANEARTYFQTATDGMTDALVNFAKTGKLSFKDLVQSMIEQAIRLQSQKAVMALMGMTGDKSSDGTFVPGMTDSGSGFGSLLKSGWDWLMSANGNAFDGGVHQFAKGGAFGNGTVLTGPTPFLFAKGGAFAPGVAGEAGPEGALPLKRMNNGKLGVYADVNGGASTQVVNHITINVEGGNNPQETGEVISKRLVMTMKQIANEQIQHSVRQGGVLSRG